MDFSWALKLCKIYFITFEINLYYIHDHRNVKQYLPWIHSSHFPYPNWKEKWMNFDTSFVSVLSFSSPFLFTCKHSMAGNECSPLCCILYRFHEVLKYVFSSELWFRAEGDLFNPNRLYYMHRKVTVNALNLKLYYAHYHFIILIFAWQSFYI